jgi:cytochrome P450
VTDNYIVPKGATLISSMAAMHMNSNYYEDPHLFKPERFIYYEKTMEEATQLESNKRDHFGFGWGRRICPGIHLVRLSITKGLFFSY